MPIKDIRGLPNELQQFFAAAGNVFIKPFSILGVAESLTDEVATELVMLTGLPEKKAIQFVRALHFCDFVVERNSEWHFSQNILEFLNKRIDIHSELVQKAHQTLFDIAIKGDVKSAGKTIPRYLVSGIGRAYHKSPSSPKEGLEYYSQAANKLADGSQWLLGKLAIEQQSRGILPASAIEPSFIRGMTLYKEQRYEDAEKLFRRVILSKEIRIEVAIACHIVGRQIGRKAGGFTEAEELLRRSIEIGEEIKHYHHQAQALHTLGQLLGKDRSRAKEAEELLRRSIELLKQVNDKHGQAQALHTLGQLLGKDRSRAKEAEELLRRSIELLKQLNDKHGQAQALHTLGQLLGKDRSRAKEAEELLRRSLLVGEKINNINHQAQVLFSLGKLIFDANPNDGRALLLRSIELNKRLKNTYFVKLVNEELAKRG
ncbi:tetratricopeptide repeat protein [Shewanella algae]|uniref:tetratricopeptide repeat protein n=4 Tax=Shewanella TaxID=22 RepID=UPI001AAC7090|nr:tetratricopeptide repeat protein [Shewanella algae]MBO2701829.1 tetratricopeptide repeat protein [Shewanella algae]